jgi:hypothetical protein
VRLQHPLGVDYQDGQLYVADTYNSKIKVIDPAQRQSRSLLGGPKAGWRDGTEPLFNEPGGLSIGENTLYIADTNNHAIRVANLASGEVTTLVLVDTEGLLTRAPAGADFPGEVIVLDEQQVGAGEGALQLDIRLPAGYKINDLAPFSMSWQDEHDLSGPIQLDPESAEQRIVQPELPLELPATFTAGETTLTAELVIYYCEAEAQSLCLIEQVQLVVPVTVTATGESRLAIRHDVPTPPLMD